jgi:hypothetical protein
MAFDKLTAENPQALKKANAELKALSDDNPKLTIKESNYPFVECATLADDIRMKGGQWQ